MFKELGFDAHILCQWIHPDLSDVCKHLSTIKPSDRDIIVNHYAGYSEYAVDYVLDNNATIIILYHNITPHKFFDQSSEIYTFCKKGREQLSEIIPHYH